MKLYDYIVLMLFYPALAFILVYCVWDIAKLFKQYRTMEPKIFFCSTISKARLSVSIMSMAVLALVLYLFYPSSNEMNIRFILTRLIPPYLAFIPIAIFRGVLIRIAITDKGLIVFGPFKLPVNIVLWENINNVEYEEGRIIFNYLKKQKSYKIEMNSLSLQDKSLINPIIREYLYK